MSAADVPIGDSIMTVPQIAEMLGETSPGGGTPAAAALTRALEYYTTGAGAALEGDKFVLFITDGSPNCNPSSSCDASRCTVNLEGRCTGPANCCAELPAACVDDVEVLSRIEALANEGVDTFVVGLPGSEAYASYLAEFALAGGRPKVGGSAPYYAVTAAGGVEGLASVLGEITAQLATSCDVPLTQAPYDSSNVDVAVDCELAPRARSGDGGPVGDWRLDFTMNPPTIQILGTLCDTLTRQGADLIEVRFGCPRT